MLRICRLFRSCVFFAGCWLLAATALVQSVSAQPAPAQAADDLFRDGDTIVFFGDSITQGGNYIDHVEAALLSRYPERRFTVLNRGISSETISGTSEPDHDPRRPWAHERFTRDITPLKPQVLIACFGMNDGNYHPFDWPRFEKYQDGVRRLIQRAQEEAGVRTLILMTPPPFDPYQRRAGDPAAKDYGYKFAAIDYDQTLARYSDWLRSLTNEGHLVVDLHGSLNRHLRQRRQTQVSFKLAPDAVHPDMTGHWLMSLQILRQLGLHERPVTVTVGDDLLATGGQVKVKFTGYAPIDPQVDVDSIVLERAHPLVLQLVGSNGRPIVLNRPMELIIDGIELGPVSSSPQSPGLLAMPHPDLAITKARHELLKKVRERRQLEYWQFRAGTDKPLGNKPPADDIPAKIDALTREIDALRQPVEGTVELRVRPGNRP